MAEEKLRKLVFNLRTEGIIEPDLEKLIKGVKNRQKSFLLT
ncbi:MAG: hypothetical protein ACTSWE_04075 [Promethearchaeota archaeon]